MAVAVAAVVAGLLYARAVRRHPRRWPAGRSAAFAGAVAAALATPLVGDATLTRHMVEHLLVGMAVPFLVALAAPVTLVLQTGAPGTRRVVRTALHRAPARVLVHPVVGLCLFGAGLVAVYLSPLLERAADDEAVHVAVHVHLLASGLLFVVPLVGADVLPRPVPHAARFLAVLAAVPFHAFLGVAMLSADEPLAPDAYPSLDDQRRAAGVLWAGGEALSLAAAGVVFLRWWTADQRRTGRSR